MSDFTISNDWKHNPAPTRQHLERLADIMRQCRTDDDIRHDNAAAQADYDRERNEGWSVR